jgi:hypothetical protein
MGQMCTEKGVLGGRSKSTEILKMRATVHGPLRSVSARASYQDEVENELTANRFLISSMLLADLEYGREYTTSNVPPLLTRLLCKLGRHDFRMINKTFEFGTGGGIETVECLRCGITMTRHG